jgi:hypothetical protein
VQLPEKRFSVRQPIGNSPPTVGAGKEWKRGPSQQSNDRKAGADVSSVAPKTDRRKTMKSGTRQKASGIR